MKNPAETIPIREARDAGRDWFARLLWRAFPGDSENEVAERAASALGVSRRQARNWLRGEHCAGLGHVFAVCMIAGVELTLGGGR